MSTGQGLQRLETDEKWQHVLRAVDRVAERHGRGLDDDAAYTKRLASASSAREPAQKLHRMALAVRRERRRKCTRYAKGRRRIVRMSSRAAAR